VIIYNQNKIKETLMSRVEKFKQIRQLRKKYVLSFLLFFLLITGGLCITDYFVNNLMQDKKCIEIISFKNIKDSQIEISFMNQKVYINMTYVKRDYQRLKNAVENVYKSH
jgi:ABC-type antimicrobial peptide transport system permease subunit